MMSETEIREQSQIDNGLSAEEIALYDRQIRLWGLEAQARMRSSHVLIINLGGIGTEVSKNLVLGGIGKITIQDSHKFNLSDLSSGFFFRPEYEGEYRVKAALPQIQKLNNRANLTIDTEELKLDDSKWFAQFDIVVATELRFDKLLKLNDITRKYKIPFYASSIHGFYGFIFNDLIKYTFTFERQKPNIETKIGPETASRTIISSKIRRSEEASSTVKGGHDWIETLTKEDSFSSLSEIFKPTKTDNSTFLSGGVFKHKLRPRQLLKVTPILPLLFATWNLDTQGISNEEIKNIDTVKLKELAIIEAYKNGIPSNIITDDIVGSFIRNLHADFSPSAAILGGILAQDVINILGQTQQPLNNLLILDGVEAKAPFYTL